MSSDFDKDRRPGADRAMREAIDAFDGQDDGSNNGEQLDFLPPPPENEGGHPQETARGAAPTPPSVTGLRENSKRRFDPGRSGDDEPSRGVGRPAGRANRSTEQVRTLYLSKFEHPLMQAGRILAMHPIDIAVEFRLQPNAATDLWGATLKTVLPYLAKKQPIAIEGEGGNVTFNFHGDGPVRDAVMGSATFSNREDTLNFRVRADAEEVEISEGEPDEGGEGD